MLMYYMFSHVQSQDLSKFDVESITKQLQASPVTQLFPSNLDPKSIQKRQATDSGTNRKCTRPSYIHVSSLSRSRRF